MSIPLTLALSPNGGEGNRSFGLVSALQTFLCSFSLAPIGGEGRGEGATSKPDGYAFSKNDLAQLAILSLITFFASSSAMAETNTVTTTASPASLPDAGASVVRVFGALVLVIAIFLGGVWLFKNWQRLAIQRGGGAKLNLIEVKSLGQRQALYVVGYQQQRMLVASSPAGITLLSHLPAAEENAEAKADAPMPKMSFAEAFQQVLSRKS